MAYTRLHHFQMSYSFKYEQESAKPLDLYTCVPTDSECLSVCPFVGLFVDVLLLCFCVQLEQRFEGSAWPNPIDKRFCAPVKSKCSRIAVILM